MADEQGRVDPREDEEGPEGSKLAPEGNTDARLFIPKDADQDAEDHPEEDSDEDAQEGGREGEG
jgi:hypothetical protein